MAYAGAVVEQASLAALVVATLLSVFVAFRVSERSLTARLRTRLLLGVPWATLAVILGLYLVFFYVQGAANGEPVVVAFRSWSYFYPLGILTAGFAHNGILHLTGNVISALAFAPVAEYAWSHFPTQRGSQSFASLPTNPFARAGAFVLAVAAVGLATSLFTPGALIGFSGVVFAFAGFALVTRPLLAVGAIVARDAIGLVYRALQTPVFSARTQVGVSEPFWANVAIQGHALGLLIGVLLGAVVVRRRDAWPDGGRVWFAALVFAVSQALYAFYVPLSTSSFVLFRGFGAAAVFLLAMLVALAVTRTDATLVDRIDLHRREAAVGLLVAAVLALSVAAVPYNLATVDSASEDGVEVRDYTVTYVEDVPNRYIEAVELPVIDRAVQVRESGVVVTSPKRNAWEVVVSATRLGLNGRASVPVGGLGWKETVYVNRTTWSAVGGGSAYKVYARHDGDRELLFRSGPATANPVVNGSRFNITPTVDSYAIEVLRNGSVVASTPIPGRGTNRTIVGLTFNRSDGRLRVVHEQTRVVIATRRTGRGR